jgi:hypothetical protein
MLELIKFCTCWRKTGVFTFEGRELWFSSNSAVLFGFHRIDAMSFCFAYSSCGCCKQACGYVTNENLMDFRWWDKLVLLPMALVQVGVTLRPLLPTWPFKSNLRSPKLRWCGSSCKHSSSLLSTCKIIPVGKTSMASLSHQVWAFLCHEAPDLRIGQGATCCRCVEQGH